MKEVKVEFESANEHYNKLMQPVLRLKALSTYLAVMFPTYTFSITKDATQAMLTHPKDKDYVMINLDKDYMINSVSYYSNEVVNED